MAEENIEKKTAEQKAEIFFAKTKYVWIGLVCAVFVAVIVLGIVMGITNRSRKNASDFYEDAVFKYETSINASDKINPKEAKVEFVNSLTSFVEKQGKNKCTIRFYCTLAKLEMDEQNWENAINFWQDVVKCDEKSYLAGIANFNIAVCYENLGDNENAIFYYEKASNVKDFHLKPHALFNQARLLEETNVEKALSIYSNIAEKYAEDEWFNLAKSRMIYLNSNK